MKGPSGSMGNLTPILVKFQGNFQVFSAFEYWEGVCPVIFLKYLLKEDFELNPQS